MTTIMPHDELLRKALLYVDERLRANPDVPLGALLDEAGARFNLSPKDGEALLGLFRTARELRRERNA